MRSLEHGGGGGGSSSHWDMAGLLLPAHCSLVKVHGVNQCGVYCPDSSGEGHKDWEGQVMYKSKYFWNLPVYKTRYEGSCLWFQHIGRRDNLVYRASSKPARAT